VAVVLDLSTKLVFRVVLVAAAQQAQQVELELLDKDLQVEHQM
jgi:hypothetical protein